MRKYIVTIESAESYPVTYTMTTRSITRIAAKVGHCEYGETITVSNMHGVPIARAMYTPEDGGRYYRCELGD